MTPAPEERRANCVLHAQQIKTVEDKVGSIESKVSDIHKIICGNGKMGVCGKVDIMWGIGIFVISGLGISVGALIWEMIKN